MTLSASDLSVGQVLLALLSLLGGGGGLVAWYRARGQNQTDERKQLTEEQASFRASMAAEIARLSALQQAEAVANDKLESELAEQGKQLARLQALDVIKEGQIKELQDQNRGLLVRSETQQAEIESLREEKARVVQQLTVAQATKEFLERENAALRQEASGLRAEIDALRSPQPNGES